MSEEEIRRSNFNNLVYGIIIMGVIVVIVVSIVMYDNYMVNVNTLNEVCTQLSGEPSEMNYPESTSEQIICNPIEKPDEKVLDDGKIILKGYKEKVKEWTPERIDELKEYCRRNGYNGIDEKYKFCVQKESN